MRLIGRRTGGRHGVLDTTQGLLATRRQLPSCQAVRAPLKNLTPGRELWAIMSSTAALKVAKAAASCDGDA